MLLYRFADKNDVYRGMYRATSGEANSAIYMQNGSDPDDYSGGSLHPTPERDSKIKEHLLDYPSKAHHMYKDIPHARFYYGFSSILQARRWLHDDTLVRLLDPYLKLYVYEVDSLDNYIEGYTQALADLRFAKLVGTYTIEQFINGEVE